MSWVNTSPAVIEGVVFAGSSDERFLQAVDARTGKERWRLATERPVWSSPAVAGDDGVRGGRLRDDLRGGPRDRPGAVAVQVGAPDLRVAGDRRRDAVRRQRRRRGVRHPRRRGAARPGGVLGQHAGARLPAWCRTASCATTWPQRGYEVLDAGGLAAFMRTARRRPRAQRGGVLHRSPAARAWRRVAADSVLFRRYLDGGGKVVWTGIPPLIWPRDPKTGEGTEYIHIDRAGTSRPAGREPRSQQLRQLRRGGDRGGPALGTVGMVGQQLERGPVRGHRDPGAGRQRPRQLVGQALRRASGNRVRADLRGELVGGAVPPPIWRRCRRWRSTGRR